MNGKMTALVFKGMLTALDCVEDELEELRQEDDDDAGMRTAYGKAERMLARVRCDIQDAFDGVTGGGRSDAE
jgi:hypothetical protein